MGKWYSVVKGRTPGVYGTWAEAEAQVVGFKGAQHRAFPSKAQCNEHFRQQNSMAHLNEEPRLAPRAYVDGGDRGIAQWTGTNGASARESYSAAVNQYVDPDIRYQLHFDGASRGNPGPAGAGAVITEVITGDEVGRVIMALGTQTNNVAEYAGLMIGLEAAHQIGIEDITVYGDSKLVIFQVEGVWQCGHPGLRPLHTRLLQIKSKFRAFRAYHVYRNDNAFADHLSNLALDGTCWDGICMHTGHVLPIKFSIPALLKLEAGATALKDTNRGSQRNVRGFPENVHGRGGEWQA